jgi:hypothetical protein
MQLAVLPATLSRAQVVEIMEKVISPALGVKCGFCHEGEDYAKDTPRKQKAREMMRMTRSINEDSFAGQTRVTCLTCHNGAERPKSP